ncbi:Xylulose-1,5-bisphosphate phosphatase CbbY, converts this Rubisco inhibiting byproduct to xylulose-5P [Bathymodiolus thermophilus thioautotrophic gill symbiont]|jgi:HAD superfamily hydrolase (TIGR01509 family)|uniref:HAD-superfamily hydrolase, subfamily IA,variant 3 n=3 Tax=sulfur-oxidizing symbionts TaxID=32036 RepID=A0A1H6JBA4_9GAMM|nr:MULTISPECIES: HAD-IA family hydrolase [Gammaproteobacteria]CAC5841927.1 Xylulose-1,5-bisphosphate phosphatase CbbY, converts this Rubisco inhibiting byproduct to xylulose-5P [uncultured Gammaproteobacteria bacterium]CAB5497566.1 Xylulose-1,5-bisphosphate phosphatase CbbY, converts this Rubisco inhibiting byproduct to xylulose-5P [Bathymodiolus azoricus thioautotrophic gill symbiont]CAB5507023.1 Xylulose-1,5-bisphosphate phosphatase CbbY, converts this Rubisco inhibiting byproduct to xylulose-
MALEALIFDVDGTLANTERDGHLVAFNEAFKELGLDWLWTNALYHELLDVTGGQLRIKHYLKTHRPDFECDDIDALAKKVHGLKTKIYVRLADAGAIPLRTGVARLFSEARKAGLRLAIATTTTPANVDALITHTLGADALDWFEVIGAGDIVPNLKPAGDIYHYVLKQMNLKPNQAIAFEDSHNGIVSSTDAGLKTLITVNEYTKTHQFDGAMAVLNHLGEPNNKPFTVLEGERTEHTYVGIDYLQELYANTY